MKPSLFRGYVSKFLSPSEMRDVRTSFDVIGDIAIIRVPLTLQHRRHIIAQAVMKTNSSIKTVLNQVNAVSGLFRLRELEYLLGEEKTRTIYQEYQCRFKVDLTTVYFSPRLSFERMRITNLVNRGETILNMFAGVGCYSIMIAKHRPIKQIYSIDLNPKAVELMKDNVQLNRVVDKVTIIEGDAQNIISMRLKQSCNRVLMPLPELAYEYIESAIQALKDGRGTIHYYDVIFAEKSEDPIKKLRHRIEPRLRELVSAFKIDGSRVVRMVGPRWYQIVLDIHITKVKRYHEK
jgi:tRNA (guanine37-N1)-methyltransferase